MTFNPDADISGNKTRRGGKTAVIAGAGGIGVVGIIVYLVSAFTGTDLSGLIPGGTTGDEGGSGGSSIIENCDTGADANSNVDCRMAGAQVALDAYWGENVEGYAAPTLTVVDGSTQTQCGTASNAVGPFYCPPDQGVYIDPTFFTLMQQQFGASAGDLAQLYIVGHEWGHHIQNIAGTMAQYPNNGTGPDSNSVRTELQADCYAGSWIGRMTEQTDADGDPYLQKPTEAQLKDALGAAFAVGDDHIQEQSGFNNPESWTHGSSDQRQYWFAQGYENGLGSCDTFTIDGSQL